MMVTSNHLEVVPQMDNPEETAGEELTKRPDNFGQPVGKGTVSSGVYFIRMIVRTKVYSPLFILL